MYSTNYVINIDKKALKDLELLKKHNLKSKVDSLLHKMEVNPLCNPPSYEKLTGELQGAYSRRINIKHRLVYKIDKTTKIITIIRMWTHYE